MIQQFQTNIVRKSSVRRSVGTMSSKFDKGLTAKLKGKKKKKEENSAKLRKKERVDAQFDC